MKSPSSQRVLKDLGRRISELRRERGLTQAALAESMEVTPRYVQSLEAGRENLTINSLVVLAGELEVSVATLFEPPLSRVARRPGRPRRADT